ncbi:ATP adenylyltransferase-domain-containing protein [Sparassis latifolia]
MSSHSAIIASLSDNFERALASGDLLFFPSTVYKHNDHGIEFEIRLCTALQQKPSLPTPHFDPAAEGKPVGKARKPDPFAPPYIPNLYLGEIRDEEDDSEYVILLNKYSVVPHHILLVTKEYKSQASPLLPAELAQIYTFLVAARQAGRHFFAFYNCGDLSGASQPHKHVQFLPIEDDGPPIERLARSTSIEVITRPFSLTTLPYANHVRRLPSNLASVPRSDLEGSLSDAFLSLLDLAISTIRHDGDYPPGSPSYNFVLTLEHMHVIPRRREHHVLQKTGDQLSVNALGFTGLLLVKSEKELDAVKMEGVGKILRDVGLESVHELQLEEFSHETD